MPVRFFLQSLSVFPAPAGIAMDIASEAGFDGLEIFRMRCLWQYPSLARYRQMAAGRSLDLHFHEAPGWNNDTTHPELNLVLGPWGALVPTNASLEEQFHDAPEPVVAYGYHWKELLDGHHPNWTLQTMTIIPDGSYNLPFEKFKEVVEKFNLPLTFDTQHFLEYQSGTPGVEHLEGELSSALLQRLIDFFDSHRAQIREIHLNNFVPLLGHGRGRNLFPEMGILPLREFCAHVRASGWEGTVHPELHPRFFSRFSKSRNVEVAKLLREAVERCWYGL